MKIQQIRNLLFLLVLLLNFPIPMSLKGQSNEDFDNALMSRLENDPANNQLVDSITRRIFSEIYKNPEVASTEAQRLRKFAESHKNHILTATMFMYEGIAYDFRGLYDSAFLKFDAGLLIAREHNLELIQGDILNNYSITLAVVGQMGTSIEYALKALTLVERSVDSTRMAKVYNNLGLRYSELGFNETALDYYLKASTINERTSDTVRLVRNYGNIGILYYEMEEHQKALDYLSRSLEMQDTLVNRLEYSISLHSLGQVFSKMGQNDKAMDYENRAYKIAFELQDELGIITILQGKARILMNLGKLKDALEKLNSAFGIAQRIGARSYLVGLYKDMGEVYARMNDFQKAFFYQELYTTQKDSIQSVEKNKALELIKQFENEKNQKEIQLLTKDSEINQLTIRRQKIVRNAALVVGILMLIMALLLLHRYRYVTKTNNELEEKNTIIKNERDRSEQLLLNILPAQTAEELKTMGRAEAKHFEEVTVLFTDFVGFTRMAETMSAEELVGEIDNCFKNFDLIITNLNIEKIKTIGDSYMCAGGLPVVNDTHATDVVSAAIVMQRFMNQLKEERLASGRPYFEMRIGIHTGPVIAGVVGTKKYQYDIWGDTVNIASRLESCSEPGKINISQTTWQRVKDKFSATYRGKLEAKNKGFIDMYFIDIQ